MTKLPTTLFKYTRREYADAMLKHGVFKIGTLHGFRRIEELGSAVGDAGEGTKQVFDEATGHWRDITSRPNLAQAFISAPPDANITFSNVGFEVSYDIPDVFVYCVAATLSQRAMDAFEADACLEITDPKRFFKALDAALRARHLVMNYLVGACIYDERRRHVRGDGGVHPAFLKPREYDYQCEIRCLWEPRARPIEPLLIESLRAARLLRERRLTSA